MSDYHKSYYLKNKHIWQKDYKESRESILQRKKLHRESNIEAYKFRDKLQYESNPKKRIDKSVNWAKKNPGKKRNLTAKRQYLKLQRMPKWLSREQLSAIKQFYLDAAYLTHYTKTKFSVDHIVPLQGKNVSGLHVPWNLQLMTLSENCSKNNRKVG